MISIITPVFNRAELVVETIESVLAQTNDAWELILVDDGSTDGSLEVLHWYAEKYERIRCLSRYREPKGACTCRNLGVKHSSSDYICFLDSDDLIGPNFIETRLKSIDLHREFDFLVFPETCFRNSPSEDSEEVYKLFTEKEDLVRFFHHDQPFITTGPTWKRESLQGIEAFNENLSAYQDWELNIRSICLGLTYKKIPIDKPDIFHRLGGNHETIGSKTTSDNYLNVHLELLHSMHSLHSSEQLSVNQGKLHFYMIGFFLRASIGLKKSQQSSNSLLLLKELKKLELLNSNEYWWWSMYIGTVNKKGKTFNTKIIHFMIHRFTAYTNYLA